MAVVISMYVIVQFRRVRRHDQQPFAPQSAFNLLKHLDTGTQAVGL